MRKYFILGVTLMVNSFSNAQVGINTTDPNDATVLDIKSNEKGILIPRLTDLERDTKLADNDPATVPPIGVVNTALASGTLIYNTTENRFEFWDGVLWRQLFVATSSEAGNDGVVKINGGAGGTKPSYSLSASGSTYGTMQQVTYTTPLTFASSPTTSWPETTPDYNNPAVDKTPYIYIGSGTTQRWRENNVSGQVHIWRMIATVTPNSNSGGSIRATLSNPDSGFKITSVQLVPNGSNGNGNTLTFYFYTVADQESLAVGRGYQLFVESDLTCNLTIESLTRVSLFKD